MICYPSYTTKDCTIYFLFANTEAHKQLGFINNKTKLCCAGQEFYKQLLQLCKEEKTSYPITYAHLSWMDIEYYGDEEDKDLNLPAKLQSSQFHTLFGNQSRRNIRTMPNDRETALWENVNDRV